MKKAIFIAAALVVFGLAYAGQIEVKQDKDGRVAGWSKNESGKYNLSAEQTAKVFEYNGEPFDELRVVDGNLVFVIHPTPTPIPDLFALYTALEARVTILEGL